jgi:hypothetical protein
MDRKSFIIMAGASAIASGPMAYALGQAVNVRKETGRISKMKNNTAIAMWDFSWILRHHPGGSFENWEQVLEGLAERGYDSIRMDCMPQFVASDTDGRLQEEFQSVFKPRNSPVMWGNDVTMSFRPREALLEFLPLCRKYGIKVGLSSWFMRHGTNRTAIFQEEGGLLRAWKETLAFLEKNGLLDQNIMYVDLLNEYPDWHGYDWLKNERDQRSDLKQFKADNPDANMPDPETVPGGRNNPVEKEFYNGFVRHLVREVRKAFPQCDYFASISSSYGHVDISEFDALDRHLWFTGRIPGAREMQRGLIDENLKQRHLDLRKYWDENRKTEIEWADQMISAVADDA